MWQILKLTVVVDSDILEDKIIIMPTKRQIILRALFERYIRGTKERTPVVLKTVFFCYLTRIVAEKLKQMESNIEEPKVFLTTTALKHCYDKRPAEEFDFILDNLDKIITYPNNIYKNKNEKRGQFCFVKNLRGDEYFCSLEFDGNKKKMFFVTSFRLRKENYLKNYELLWSWEGGIPPS